MVLRRVREFFDDHLKPKGHASKSFTYKTTKEGPLEIAVHYPPGWKESDERPAIVFFFGGGWTNGRITQFETQADHLARRGMVAARADYRVKSRQGVTPGLVASRTPRVRSGGSGQRRQARHRPRRIVASGGSAGGHIAACTSLTEGLEAEAGGPGRLVDPNVLLLFNPALLRFEGVPELME